MYFGSTPSLKCVWVHTAGSQMETGVSRRKGFTLSASGGQRPFSVFCAKPLWCSGPRPCPWCHILQLQKHWRHPKSTLWGLNSQHKWSKIIITGIWRIIYLSCLEQACVYIICIIFIVLGWETDWTFGWKSRRAGRAFSLRHGFRRQ